MFIFRQKLDKVIASLSILESRVSRLSASSSEYAIKDLKENIQRIMGKIEAMDVSYIFIIFYVNNLVLSLNISNACFRTELPGSFIKHNKAFKKQTNREKKNQLH